MNTSKLNTRPSLSSLAERQAFIVGLLEKCPMRKSLDSCPASDLRKLSVAEKIDLVMKMSENDLGDILTLHFKCIESKSI